MSIFQCPGCNRQYDVNDSPDHLNEMTGSRFEFQCSGVAEGDDGCGATFECEVDWSPHIYPLSSTLTSKPAGE